MSIQGKLFILSVDLLEEIRQRGQMKKGGLNSASVRKTASLPRRVEEDNSLGAALTRGLANIHNATHSSDSESTDSDSDSDSDW